VPTDAEVAEQYVSRTLHTWDERRRGGLSFQEPDWSAPPSAITLTLVFATRQRQDETRKGVSALWIRAREGLIERRRSKAIASSCSFVFLSPSVQGGGQGKREETENETVGETVYPEIETPVTSIESSKVCECATREKSVWFEK
jgi:hypothetical protein